MQIMTEHIGPDTPMGATLVADGTVLRTWAPSARDVYLVAEGGSSAAWSHWTPDAANRLIELGDGTWAGFTPELGDGDPYLFWVRGPSGGSEGFKRDPYARELASRPFFPNGPCLVRDAGSYPWHDRDWQPPAFHDLIIYQLHVGVFWGASAQAHHYGKFLDVAGRIPYLRGLGVTAIQLLPIQEYDGDFGLGYAGLDYFSPEMVYQVEDTAELALQLGVVNALLAEKGLALLTEDDLAPGPNQLKCLVDLCHLNGIAVIFDLVYNHAGGGFDDRSLWFYDRQPGPEHDRSLYFTDKGWAGGKVFAYWQAPVRQFLIDNATFFLREYKIDGIRYDEVTVIHKHGGDDFCRELTHAVRSARPAVIQIAEYWDPNRDFPVTEAPQGLGFDAASGDGLRDALRSALAEAAGGAGATVHLDRVRNALHPPPGFPAPWAIVQCLEDHDKVLWDYGEQRPRAPRIAKLADSADPRSWYARSRSRVATTLLLTAPGIPMLFMGQEILEDKPWHDDIRFWSQFLVWWDGLLHDRAMQDFLHFMQDLIWLRRSHPGLRGGGICVPQVHERDRIIVMHRWVEKEGRDMMVIASLNEQTLPAYCVEFPWPGEWHEVFNSDFYDHFPNPWVIGNAGGVRADGPGGRSYPYTGQVTIPANGVIVLARVL